MSTSAPTLIDLKNAFLRAQILQLAQPLTSSPSFLAKKDASENALRQKAIDDALHKLNLNLKKHNQLAYGPQATRHVAEQIDRLYWGAGEGGVRVGEEWAERGGNLRKEEMIEQLPEEWSEEAELKAPEQAAKFKALQQRLTQLSEKRRLAREKVEQCKALKELVDPFGEDGGVQGNLVTKNGEVEQELERMRRLMLRVERGIGTLEDRREGEDEDMVDVDEGEGRALALLALLGTG